MSLVKLKKTKPFGNLVTSDFFGNGFRNQGILNDSFWSDRIVEPALNIKANEGKYEMALTTLGNTKKDIKITIDDGCLNISAKKAKSEKDKKHTRREFSYKAFERSLQLPENIKNET